MLHPAFHFFRQRSGSKRFAMLGQGYDATTRRNPMQNATRLLPAHLRNGSAFSAWCLHLDQLEAEMIRQTPRILVKTMHHPLRRF